MAVERAQAAPEEHGRCADVSVQRRAEAAWTSYQEFRAAPGQKCADCWLLVRFCCCQDLAGICLRQRVVVLMHHTELNRRRGSNTAKLLLRFGAELLVWGVREHDQQLRELLDSSNAVILFPEPGTAQGVTEAAAAGGREPDCIIVLDGGWKATRKMNQSLDCRITRCCVTNATPDEYGRTRKYKNGEKERVQTAGAFIALLKDLGEDGAKVRQLLGGLRLFLGSFERQLHWSGVREEDLRTRVPAGPAVPGVVGSDG